MALAVTNVEIPPEAVVLTKQEAIQYRWNQIYDWKPRREVWPFTHGLGFLGGIATISSLIINARIRRVMKMRKFGNAASIISTSICPGILTTVAQMQLVAEKTFLPIQTCPLCIEMKSLVVQNSCSVIYPAILSPIINLMIAKRIGTFRMPNYTNWKEILYFGANLYKPVVPSLIFLSAINSLVAMFIVYKQFNCISYMQEMLTIDKESYEMDTKF